jgi:2-iminobutanoate/2-iminopropanoate deaminase
MKQIISTDKAPAAIGPYSQAVKINGMVYTAGQIPIDPANGEVLDGDIKAQAELVLKNMEALLKASRCELLDVVKTTCFLKDMADFTAFNEVYGKYFKENPPARSCVAVKTLPKDVLVEVEAVAFEKN